MAQAPNSSTHDCTDVSSQESNSMAETSASNNPLVALFGQWPGDIDDGFEEAIREMRDRELLEEPPSWA